MDADSIPVIYNTECMLCGLHYTRKNVVKGKGNIKSNILLLGEAPGEDEDEEGICFVGRAGKQELDPLLKHAGLSYTEPGANCYIDNPVRCRPVKYENGKIRNDKPNIISIKSCTEYTLELLQYMKPKLIIALGVVATNFIAELDRGLADNVTRGCICIGNSYAILPLFHPSAHFHRKSNKEDNYRFIDDNRNWINYTLQSNKLAVQ